MAALPVGQAAEVRTTLAFEGGGKEHQRGGPPAVSVVGRMFNFTPFFHTLEVIAAKKERSTKPSKRAFEKLSRTEKVTRPSYFIWFVIF